MPTEIVPAIAEPSAGEKVTFTHPDAAHWRTEPPGLPGLQGGAGSCTYTAPMPILVPEQFQIVALKADMTELDRSGVQLRPTQMKVLPPKVEELRARDSIRFSVEPPELAPRVSWFCSDKEVEISEAGVLTAPESIASSRNVIVTALWENAGGTGRLYGTATVKVSDHNFKAWFASLYSLCLAVGLIGVVIWLVATDCLDEKKSTLNVVPPVVTLRPEDTQRFQARMACASNMNENAVLWQATGGTITNGVFQAKMPTNDPPATVTITAVTKGDPCETAMASVFISATGRLEIVPSFLKVTECQSYQFDVATLQGASTYTNYHWRISPEQGAGTITADGLYLSPNAPGKVRYARIMASAKTDPRIQAAALVELPCSTGCGGNKALRQLFLILVLGALGSTIHCMRSLGDYVGNQKFASSWFLFYIFKPVIGAALAFFVVSQGALKGDSGTISIGWGALAALVGLFSEQALGKLGEIATTLFGRSVKPASDDGRGNKLEGNTRPTIPPEEGPVLLKADLGNDTPRTLTVTGIHFTPDCKIKIGDQERVETTFESPNTLKLVLSKADLAQKSLKVSVTNKAKQSSASRDVSIT